MTSAEKPGTRRFWQIPRIRGRRRLFVPSRSGQRLPPALGFDHPDVVAYRNVDMLGALPPLEGGGPGSMARR